MKSSFFVCIYMKILQLHNQKDTFFFGTKNSPSFLKIRFKTENAFFEALDPPKKKKKIGDLVLEDEMSKEDAEVNGFILAPRTN